MTDAKSRFGTFAAKDTAARQTGALSVTQQRSKEIVARELEALPESYITDVQFSVLSSEEIVIQSVLSGEGVTDPRLGIESGQVNDSRMGISYGNSACRTCGRGRTECPGHMGHIEFRNIGPEMKGEDVVPMTTGGKTRYGLAFYNPLFFTYIIDLSRIICHKCSRIRQRVDTLVNQGLLPEKARAKDTKAYCEKVEEEDLDEENVDEGDEVVHSIRGLEKLGSDDEEEEDEEGALTAAAEEAAAEDAAGGIGAEVKHPGHAEATPDEAEAAESLSTLSSHIRKIAEYIDSNKNGNVCVNCGNAQEQVDLSASRKTMEIVMGKRGKDSFIMDIHTILGIFQRVSKNDQEILDITDPSRFIIQTFPVLPPRFRAATMTANNTQAINNMTIYIRDIVEARRKIIAIGYPAEIWTGRGANETQRKEFNSLVSKIRNSIYALMDSSKAVGRTRSANERIAPTIVQKLVDKKGLIRGAMTGKRVVLTSRQHAVHVEGLDFDEIAMSPETAEELSKPEVVTTGRREHLQRYLVEGKAKSIITFKERKRNFVKSIGEHTRANYKLRLGDVLFRPLETGDVVAAGRQPTIHKTSMMGYRVKIVKGLRGFGIALPVTMYHNADFDGDEFTVHVPFSAETEAEIAILMSPVNYIIDGENNRPGVAQTFNALTAAFDLTSRKVPLGEKVYELLRERMRQQVQKHIREAEEKKEVYIDPLSDLDRRLKMFNIAPRSGQGIFSMLLPPNFNYEGSRGVLIRNGVHIRGVITDADIGRKERSITHELAIQHGIPVARNFINDANIILNFYLDNVGFTISLQDCLFVAGERLPAPGGGYVPLMESEERKKIIAEVEKIRAEKQLEIETLRTGMDKLSPYEQQRRKAMIIEKLNVLSTYGSKLSQDLMKKGYNPLAFMVESGAKGSKETMAQIIASVGQSTSRGQPMAQGTSWFRKEDMCIEANGFCTGSFAGGLDPRQAFAHAWGSREGIRVAATAVPVTGDMQNRITRLTEGTVVMPDGTVRSRDTGRIIQGTYCDGFDGAHVFNVTVRGQPTLSYIDLKSVADNINRKLGF